MICPQSLHYFGMSSHILYSMGKFVPCAPELRSTNLDSDWLYRRLGPLAAGAAARRIDHAAGLLKNGAKARLGDLADWFSRHHGPQGAMARTWPTGATVLWVAILLGAFLIASFSA